MVTDLPVRLIVLLWVKGNGFHKGVIVLEKFVEVVGSFFSFLFFSFLFREAISRYMLKDISVTCHQGLTF